MTGTLNMWDNKLKLDAITSWKSQVKMFMGTMKEVLQLDSMKKFMLDEDEIKVEEEIKFEFGLVVKGKEEGTKSVEKVKKKDVAAAVTIPDHPSILHGPDIWICDSGCTTHMMPHMQGFSKVEFHKESVTMANGQDEGSSFSGNIVGMKVDNQGNEDFPIELNNVSYNPGSVYNLFSTSVLTQKGWLLFGNNKSMWLEKEGTKLVFDIKVSTDKGVLYCMKIDQKSKRC